METNETRRALAGALTPSGMSIVPSPEVAQSIEEPIDSAPPAPPVPRRRLGLVVGIVVAAAVGVILVAAGGRVVDEQTKDNVKSVAATLEALEYEYELTPKDDAADEPEAKPAKVSEPKASDESEPEPKPAVEEPKPSPKEPVAESTPEKSATAKPVPEAPVAPPKATSKPAAPSTPKSAPPAKSKSKPLRTDW